ncbi:MAG: anti-sigma regulatory factor [Clostridiaceae bacterium]|nr:anti-sigma regulatory factor [Clostridiaceae bacterium]
MEPLRLTFAIVGSDFIHAGEASSGAKKALAKLGVQAPVVKRAAIAMYEAELNTVIHAGGGSAEVDIYPDHVQIRIVDQGPGIADVSLAMQEGWSTAPEAAREMGFGAGMGLPNIKKQADELHIETEPGRGTTVTIRINFPA